MRVRISRKLQKIKRPELTCSPVMCDDVLVSESAFYFRPLTSVLGKIMFVQTPATVYVLLYIRLHKAFIFLHEILLPLYYLLPRPNIQHNLSSISLGNYSIMFFSFRTISLVLVLFILAVISQAADDVSYTDNAAFQRGVLDFHNRRRAEHGTPNVAWNAEIAGQAESYARRCAWGHSVSNLSSINNLIPIAHLQGGMFLVNTDVQTNNFFGNLGGWIRGKPGRWFCDIRKGPNWLVR
jgi:hypothetical protein